MRFVRSKVISTRYNILRQIEHRPKPLIINMMRKWICGKRANIFADDALVDDDDDVVVGDVDSAG